MQMPDASNESFGRFRRPSSEGGVLARLLVVQDEESIALLSGILEAEGYQGEQAISVPEALAKIERERFDGLLLDLRLADSDGLSVLRRLKETWPDAVAIVLTGDGTFENAIEAMRAGADDVLLKPSDVEELKLSIARALKWRAQIVERNAELARINASLRAEMEERRRAEDGLRFLGKAGELLASSLDDEVILTSVAQLAVPYMADWCVVDRVAEAGAVQRQAVAHVDPAKVELARELQRCYPPDPHAPRGVPRVLRTGKPELYPEVPDALLEAAARDAEHLRTLRELGFTSAMIVPLVAREQTLGAISFITAESGRHYDAADLALAQELAHLAALAIDNARLYRSVREQMETHVRLNADMKQLAEERDALRRLAEERVGALEELNRAKEEFIATASHDLKSPITSIRGYAQLLRRRVRTPAPDLERVAQGLDVIDRQAVAMTRLLDDLLDAARIQAGSFEPRTAPCDLGECIETVLARLNPEERERVEVRLPDVPVAGDWEQKRIEQVLANVVGNALKYSPESERVSVVVEWDSGAIEVAVNDRGMGIPPDELPRLFERFHRTPQARASGLTGTGLGLYISRGIVEAHGGCIRAESAGERQGATFRFTLPIKPAGANCTETPQPEECP